MPQQHEAAAVPAAATCFPSFTRTASRRTVTVCNGDEDAITLAVSAGLRCAPAGGGRIEQVFAVLGHSPLRSGPVAEIIREAIRPQRLGDGILRPAPRRGLVTQAVVVSSGEIHEPEGPLVRTQLRPPGKTATGGPVRRGGE